MTSRPVRVLIVDDEVAIRRSLSAYLEDLDYEVVAVPSSEEGLSLLDSRSFDAAIVDMRLPGKDGRYFIAAAFEKAPDMRYLIYTGSANFQLTETLEGIGLRSEHVFRKPVSDMHELVDAIVKLVTGGAAPDE